VTGKVFLILLALVLALSVGLVACDGDWEEEEEEEIYMDDAIAIVMSEILPEISWISGGNPYLLLKLDSSLLEGTVIEEDSGYESALSITLDEDAFFFYLDLAPGAYYEHDVIYILVDKWGNPDIWDAKWWPRIAGDVPEELLKFPPDEVDVVDTNVGLAEPTGDVMEYEFAPLSESCEGFIVVQGMMDYEAQHDQASLTYLNGMEFFDTYKNNCSQLVGLQEGRAADVLDTIGDMVDEDLNPITIYIIAHGDIDAVKLGGHWFKADQFHDKMRDYSGTVFNLILGQCHSGSFIDDFRFLDNVCVVTTACAENEIARVDLDSVSWAGATDHNPDDIGSEWTSSLLEAMARIVWDPINVGLVQLTASLYGTAETCVVIAEASRGCLGDAPEFDLTQDLDLSHRCGFTHPCLYCRYDFP